MKKLLIAALLLATTPAQALTGNDYWLGDEPERTSVVAGMHSGFFVSAGINKLNAPWCPPEDVTFGQEQKILERYLRNNPEELHWDVAISYANAMIRAFPCQTTRKTSGK